MRGREDRDDQHGVNEALTVWLQTRVSTADTELKQQKKRLEHMKGELKVRSKDAKSAGKEFEKIQKELAAATSAVERANFELEACAVTPEALEQLRAKISSEEAAAA